MNNGKGISKKQLSILLLILLLLGLLSGAVLASRLGGLNKKKDDGNTIPIGDDANKISDQDGGDEDSDRPPEAELVFKHDYEIFRVSYSNDSGKVTVLSSNGEKVIAPGTSWNYNFSVQNFNDVSLDYELHITSVVEGVDMDLPVVARMRGPENKWLTGKRGAFVPLMSIKELVDTGVLASGNVANYKFSWKWPFESGGEEADALDTMLGNMELDHDITLTIKIWVYAWSDAIPDRPGGEPVPGTGDDFNVGFWVSLMVLSLLAFVAVLARDKKKPTPVQEALGYSDGDGKKSE